MFNNKANPDFNDETTNMIQSLIRSLQLQKEQRKEQSTLLKDLLNRYEESIIQMLMAMWAADTGTKRCEDAFYVHELLARCVIAAITSVTDPPSKVTIRVFGKNCGETNFYIVVTPEGFICCGPIPFHLEDDPLDKLANSTVILPDGTDTHEKIFALALILANILKRFYK